MLHHQHKVSQAHYDKGLPSLKMCATCWLAENSKDTLDTEVNPDDVQEDRIKRAIEDQKVAAEAAETLLNDASKRKYPVNRKSSQ